MKDASTLLSRIYRLKLVLTGALLLILSLVTTMLGNWLSESRGPHLLTALVSGLADVFLVTGAIGIAVDFFTGKDKDAADAERLRNILKDAAPEIRDAVISGFAETPDRMRGVATNDTLDKLATNALALRLGDAKFASEIYEEVRDQAIRASERWHDLQIKIRLSSMDERSTVGAPAGSAEGIGGSGLFDIRVEWEYTTVPGHTVRKFACVSDRDEFYELFTEIPATWTWFMPPRTGVSASDQAAFELLEFSVNGEPRAIRRSQRRTGQTYTVTIGEDIVRAARPVRIRHVCRTVGAKSAHRLFTELPAPVRGLSLEVDYTQTDISSMSVTDAVSSLAKPRVTRIPEQFAGREIQVDLDGWLMPRSGFTFVWTLSSEEPASTPQDDSAAA